MIGTLWSLSARTLIHVQGQRRVQRRNGNACVCVCVCVCACTSPEHPGWLCLRPVYSCSGVVVYAKHADFGTYIVFQSAGTWMLHFDNLQSFQATCWSSATFLVMSICPKMALMNTPKYSAPCHSLCAQFMWLSGELVGTTPALCILTYRFTSGEGWGQPQPCALWLVGSLQESGWGQPLP